METGLTFEYPWWWLILCIVAGLGYAVAMYYRHTSFNKQNTGSKWWLYALSTLRALVVSLLCILLLSPYIKKRTTETFKPIVAVVHDNSQSVRVGLKGDTILYKNKMQAVIERLSQKYEVATYTAGAQLTKNIVYTYTEPTTNLSSVFDDISNLYYNRNIGAVILASDGIYNEGVNPIYTAGKTALPVFTIALGDTIVYPDQKVVNVLHNKVVYLNDRIHIKAEVEADYLKDKTVRLTLVELTENGVSKPVAEKMITYTSGSYFGVHDLYAEATKPGVMHYRISVQPVSGEQTVKNNVKDIYIEVLDGRQKILIVSAAPHPDIAALKNAIESNKNYQVETITTDGAAPALAGFDLLLVNQVQPQANLQQLLKDAERLKKPVLFVVGSQTSMNEFNRLQTMLPVRTNAANQNETTASLNDNFTAFNLSTIARQFMSKLPPLTNYFGDYQSSPALKSVLLQKINGVATTYPLWAIAEDGEQKYGFIMGEGFWRWRIHDYMNNKNHDCTNELVNKTVQYLTVKSDKRPFRVSNNKNVYQENEPVQFEAQLYNASYEPVRNAEILMQITDADKKIYNYTFSPFENGYTLNAGLMKAGEYTYTATARDGANSFTANGKFSVNALQLEFIRTRADYKMMYQLAALHSGKMYTVNDMESVADDVLSDTSLKPMLVDTYSTQSAINLYWLFLLIVVWLGGEWMVRKYLGGY